MTNNNNSTSTTTTDNTIFESNKSSTNKSINDESNVNNLEDESIVDNIENGSVAAPVKNNNHLHLHLLPKAIIQTLKNKYNIHIHHIEELKSAQHNAYIISVIKKRKKRDNNNDINDELLNIDGAMKEGNNKLIIRIWKGSARWWNLNSTQLLLFSNSNNNNKLKKDDAIVQLAQAEVSGYRIAEQCLLRNTNNNQIIIPCVLYFSHDYRNNYNNKNGSINIKKEEEESSSCCWALFSYVGSQSTSFTSSNNNHNNNHNECNNLKSSFMYNSKFTSNMVKTRNEFGFIEAHPRHGRVHEKYSLEYALNLIKNVVLPIHDTFYNQSLFSSYSIISKDTTHDNNILHDLDVLSCTNYNNDKQQPWCYNTMLNIYNKILSQIYNDITQQEQEITTKEEHNINEKWKSIIKISIKCLNHLQQYESKEITTNLPFVLCHLDLQPQNLLFYDDHDNDDDNSIPSIRCVLDWEEAAYADPRFELLLICRKICSNDIQANTIWNYYQEQVLKYSHQYKIGTIDPWLKLETLHSIITLTLQGLNIGGRGATQWEKQCDIFDKINREFLRLVCRGWDFCSNVNVVIDHVEQIRN